MLSNIIQTVGKIFKSYPNTFMGIVALGSSAALLYQGYRYFFGDTLKKAISQAVSSQDNLFSGLTAEQKKELQQYLTDTLYKVCSQILSEHPLQDKQELRERACVWWTSPDVKSNLQKILSEPKRKAEVEKMVFPKEFNKMSNGQLEQLAEKGAELLKLKFEKYYNNLMTGTEYSEKFETHVKNIINEKYSDVVAQYLASQIKNEQYISVILQIVDNPDSIRTLLQEERAFNIKDVPLNKRLTKVRERLKVIFTNTKEVKKIRSYYTLPLYQKKYNLYSIAYLYKLIHTRITQDYANNQQKLSFYNSWRCRKPASPLLTVAGEDTIEKYVLESTLKAKLRIGLVQSVNTARTKRSFWKKLYSFLEKNKRSFILPGVCLLLTPPVLVRCLVSRWSSPQKEPSVAVYVSSYGKKIQSSAQ